MTERLLSETQTVQLRAALDRVAATELDETVNIRRSSRFGGLFLGHLMDKDQACLDMVKFANDANGPLCVATTPFRKATKTTNQ